MRHTVAQCMVGTLCVLALALTPAFAEVPEDGVIDPGHGIGPAALGMPADKLVESLGKADFQKDNDDGTILYEWGLLTQGDLPDAVLWVLIDSGSVAKVGTDGGKYQTSSGLRVGSSAEDFVRAFGFPAKNPAPGFYVFRQGIGIAVGSGGNVHTIWIEQLPPNNQ
ncbi:MAG TPA: hypothetical protein VFW01_08645 [bacterium]|nr:hypothetical protein [bacterium]